MEKNTKRTKALALGTISIISTLMIIVAPSIVSQSAIAAEKYVTLTGKGTGTLNCSNGDSFANSQISFSASVPIEKSSSQTGPAKEGSSMTLTNAEGVQTRGTILAGGWMPMESPGQKGAPYSLSGTTTTDSICSIPGSPFTINGIIGPEVPITLGGGKYTMQATGSVKSQGWHPMD